MFAFTTKLFAEIKDCPAALDRNVVPAQGSPPANAILIALVDPTDPLAGASVTSEDWFPPKSVNECPEVSLLSKLTRT